MAGRAIIIGSDLLVRTRLEAAARAAGLEISGDGEPTLVLADLDGPDAFEAVQEARVRWPAVRVAGFLSHVDAERRARAQGLGIEVYPRGATTDAAAVIAGERT